jgi:hypothetical protein
VAGQTIVFYPKYTSLVGAASTGQIYYSDPYDVTRFKTLEVETLLEVVSGAGTVAARLEQSSDLLSWSEVAGSGNLTAGTVDVMSKSDPARYVRVKITVVTANVVATLWCKGVARDS